MRQPFGKHKSDSFHFKVFNSALLQCLFVAVVVGIVFAGSPAHSEDQQANVSVSESAKKAIALLLSSRSDLHSGQFKASGYRKYVKASGDEAVQFPSEMSCDFDHRGGYLRYENRETQVVGLAKSKDLTQDVGQHKLGTFKSPDRLPRPTISMYARTPESMAEWYAIGDHAGNDKTQSQICIRHPDTSPMTSHVHPFSPTSVGILDFRSFESGLMPKGILDEYANWATSVETKIDASGRVQIEYSRDSARRVITLNPEQGYSPIAMSLFQVDDSGIRVAEPADGSEESTASWSFLNNVWVPKEFAISQTRTSGTNSYRYAISWDAVNPEQLDPKLFTYQSFQGVWPGTLVFEQRDGKNEHIGTIGEQFVQMTVEDKPLRVTSPKPDRRPVFFWLVLVNSVVGIGFVYFVLKRRNTDPK